MSINVKTERIAKLLDKAKTLPTKSGCYLMKRKGGGVIYVGKAKNLRARVSSYFNNSAKTPKTEILVSHIDDLDFLLTETEAEALVLENNLIKKHAPKYNIMMRDDKSYPYVVVNKNEPFPRLQYQRRVVRGEDKLVFGPFVHGTNISEVLRIITKSFGLRDCSLREFNSRKEPCLLYQIKQCSAPCVDLISKVDYEKDLNLAAGIFAGEGDGALKALEKRMFTASENEEFEHAAIIRDHIERLKDFIDLSKQKNAEIDSEFGNMDFIAYYVGEVEVDIAVYMVRNNILLGHKNFHFPAADMDGEVEEEIINYLFQYYTGTHDSLPELIVAPFEDFSRSIFEQALTTVGKIKVSGEETKYSSMLKLTKEQASEHQRVRLSNQESIFVGLNKLKELLGMKERPIKLECYDIAIFQGSSPTASQIVFYDGVPCKKEYRHYALEELPEGNNDFAMMKEVISRRLKKNDLPDVFIVDGGKGQVGIFVSALKELGIEIPVCGIAKAKVGKKIVKKGHKKFAEDEIEKSEERLIIPGRANPYYLNKNKSLFRIVTQMRDEAHRFSRRLHHKKEKKRVIGSWLDKVKGVGKKTREEILRKLDVSTEELAVMEVEDVENYLGVSSTIAENILNYLNEK